MSKRQLYYAPSQFQVEEIYGRPAKEVVDEVTSAFDCYAPEDDCIYLSSEITSGERVFDLLRKHGASSREHLKEKLGGIYDELWNELMDGNLAEGRAFFERTHSEGHRNLINPGPFYARGWTQEHYLYLWEWVIVHKCKEARFNSGWNYSNGCTLEYAISLRKGIRTLGEDGRPMKAEDATKRIEHALDEYDEAGIDATSIRKNLQRIKRAIDGRAEEETSS